MMHRNPTITQDASRIFNFKVGENIGEVSPIIQPVIPIARFCNIVRATGSGASGTNTIFTTPSDKDFYITSLNLSLMKDAACDTATGGISMDAVIEGVSRSLISVAVITLTAQNETISLAFPTPIKIDRGTNISCGATFTAGVLRRQYNIMGYTIETTKGT